MNYYVLLPVEILLLVYYHLCFSNWLKIKPVWNKLKKEITEHFPDVESITFETIHNCEYLRWCIL